MRVIFTPFAALAAVLALSACGNEGSVKSGPKTFRPEQQTTAAVMPADAPPQEDEGPDADVPATSPAAGEVVSARCSDTLGATQADVLVKRCIAVSPATHPPCNAANPCALIQGEIDRACGQYGPNEEKPAECTR